MCQTCGCSESSHDHHHDFHHARTREGHLTLSHSVLSRNDEIAHRNQHWFEDHEIRAINLMSSPGSGKTSLLEKTFESLSNKESFVVLTGDIAGDFDAQRLNKTGVLVRQITTLDSCHLNAEMIERELGTFVKSPPHRTLIIENVGNLVCPAAFHLGESVKVALLSTAEGEEKPIKYPRLFHEADIIVITKIDLVEVLGWDRESCHSNIRRINSRAPVLELSARTGQGMAAWLNLLN